MLINYYLYYNVPIVQAVDEFIKDSEGLTSNYMFHRFESKVKELESIFCISISSW